MGIINLLKDVFKDVEPITIEYFPDLSDDIKNKLQNFQLEDIDHDITVSYDSHSYLYYLVYKLKDLLYRYNWSHTTIHEMMFHNTLDKVKKELKRTPNHCDPKSKQSYIFLTLDHTEKTNNKKQFIWIGRKIKEKLWMEIVYRDTKVVIEKINMSKLLSNTYTIDELESKIKPYIDNYKDDPNIMFQWDSDYYYRFDFVNVYTKKES